MSVDGNSGHPSSCTSNPENTLYSLLLGNRKLKGVHHIYVGDWEQFVCFAYVHHKPQSQQRGSPINTRLSIAILYLIIVVTMALLPDIHGFK